MNGFEWIIIFAVGAVVSSDFLAGVLTQFRALFERDFSGSQQWQGWGDLAAQMDSDGELNTYSWFGTVPRMEDVTNDTVPISGLDNFNFSIRNREYQAAIEVDRMTFERDRLSQITPRISQMAEEAARHPSELIFQVMEANPLAYDGLSFFNDAHVIGGSGTFDNLLAGSGITIANIQTDLATGRAALRLFKDDKARPMNNIGNIIVIPAGLEQVFWQALNPGGGLLDRAPIPASTDGTLKGAGYTIIVNPYLVDLTDWYLYVSRGASMRPFILQTEKKVVLESDTNPNSRENIVRRKYLYSAYGRYAVGVTDPRLGIKFVNA